MRSGLTVVVAVAALVPLLGAGGQGPATERAARRIVASRAIAAEAALVELATALGPAVEAARAGAARVVAGPEPPGASLREAADLLADAAPAGLDARMAVGRLSGAWRDLSPDGRAIDQPLDAGELDSIGGQLAGTADAADAFAAMRARAEGLNGKVDEALAALDRGDLGVAATRLGAARSDHDVLSAWEIELVTLPVWLDTTDELLAALEELLDAVGAGDEARAVEAANAFAALGEEAATADRALRIAIGEGGAGVTAAPLARLADLLARLEAARADVASILQAVGR